VCGAGLKAQRTAEGGAHQVQLIAVSVARTEDNAGWGIEQAASHLQPNLGALVDRQQRICRIHGDPERFVAVEGDAVCPAQPGVARERCPHRMW